MNYERERQSSTSGDFVAQLLCTLQGTRAILTSPEDDVVVSDHG